MIMAHKPLLFVLFFAEVCLVLSSHIQLYQGTENAFEGKQGFVMYSEHLGAFSFINGSEWTYKDAMVVCRELGETFEEVFLQLFDCHTQVSMVLLHLGVSMPLCLSLKLS
jgi:hypothetical protein